MAESKQAGQAPRRWWIAGLMTLFGAGLGYLYVGRPWRALVVTAIAVLAQCALWHGLGGFLATPLGFVLVPALPALLALGFVIDSIRVAVSSRTYQLRWYNRIWVYVLAFGAWIGFAVLPEIPGIHLENAVRSFYVASGSMLPSLRPGERFMADMKAYASRPPEQGDIVVLRHPKKPDVIYVTRVIGLPGMTVQMQGGVLQIDGKPVPTTEAGTLQIAGEPSLPRSGGKIKSEVLPTGRKIDVLDTEPNGLLDNTAAFTVPAGHYFLMGDNRDNTIDSRLSGDVGLGFVAQANIIGRAAWIYWAADRSRLGQRVN